MSSKKSCFLKIMFAKKTFVTWLDSTAVKEPVFLNLDGFGRFGKVLL